VAATDRSGELEAGVVAERIGMIYRLTPHTLAMSVVGSTLILLVLWQSAPRLLLLGWYALHHLVTLLRYLLIRAYRRADPAAGGGAAVGAAFRHRHELRRCRLGLLRHRPLSCRRGSRAVFRRHVPRRRRCDRHVHPFALPVVAADPVCPDPDRRWRSLFSSRATGRCRSPAPPPSSFSTSSCPTPVALNGSPASRFACALNWAKPRKRRRRRACEVTVSRQHEPRDPDADERRSRHGRTPARDAVVREQRSRFEPCTVRRATCST
jgi:hypothetical protein